MLQIQYLAAPLTPLYGTVYLAMVHLVCREFLPSVPPIVFGQYFKYSFENNEEIFAVIFKIKYFSGSFKP